MAALAGCERNVLECVADMLLAFLLGWIHFAKTMQIVCDEIHMESIIDTTTLLQPAFAALRYRPDPV
jgi:hypothetical protein